MEKKMSIIEHLLKNRCRNIHMSSLNKQNNSMAISFDLTKEEYDNISHHLNNHDYLLNEYKEKIKLTKDEHIILKNIDKNYEWIARDLDNDLYLYPQKPEKKENYWRYSDDFICIKMFNNLFQFIKFEDEEPTNIQELLNNCEVFEG